MWSTWYISRICALTPSSLLTLATSRDIQQSFWLPKKIRSVCCSINRQDVLQKLGWNMLEQSMCIQSLSNTAYQIVSFKCFINSQSLVQFGTVQYSLNDSCDSCAAALQTTHPVWSVPPGQMELDRARNLQCKIQKVWKGVEMGRNLWAGDAGYSKDG